MAENNKLSDSELMLKVAGYDSKALEQLYDRYSPILYTLINRILNDKKIAEEVLSDVFVIIWKKIDQFEFKTNNVYTWLVTIARNKAINTLKRKKLNMAPKEDDEKYDDETILPKLSTLITPLNLEQILNNGDKVKETINSLTEAQRYVLELSYYEGLNENEIAKKLKIPLPTVKSKLLLALGILQQKLETEEVKNG
ncbi:MAG: sigma-70 family RNA polymerase sigma factor [Ignavibacteria bacterium]|nr:sigma-70 family RNA polymerase sigma factor [Ignavibacteria bacterium]MBT8382011.1 sigma-70 family RNA polymerase sigma factor [Ignavibacteria bacterium]MBT8393149.1 sigma-70 family RNA polymerase sigma factor [Ignavibacteria bacterium]NNJ52306.1 sigma-70 family RNA polymerase sigma factor [Ignavibacteriaceae bacterium]NNL20175.1 sigma-70 family RNA polymerase sigma factor [Ignavibacteriaceae bacterium]